MSYFGGTQWHEQKRLYGWQTAMHTNTPHPLPPMDPTLGQWHEWDEHNAWTAPVFTRIVSFLLQQSSERWCNHTKYSTRGSFKEQIERTASALSIHFPITARLVVDYLLLNAPLIENQHLWTSYINETLLFTQRNIAAVRSDQSVSTAMWTRAVKPFYRTLQIWACQCFSLQSQLKWDKGADGANAP